MSDARDRSPDPDPPGCDFDVLSDVLGSVRLTGAMLFLIDATTPWITWAPEAEVFRPAVLPQSQHVISYHIVTEGSCWAGLRCGSPERYEAGDVLVIPHGDAYSLAEPRDAQQTYGTEEAVEFFRCMAAGGLPPMVGAGGGGPERTQFICGFLGCHLRPFNPVLAALPRVIHLRGASRSGDRMQPLIDFALNELRGPTTGGRGVLMRVAELMFVEVVRRHLETMAESRTGWLAGLNDPLVARALSLLHAEPARPWTLATLATRAGTSRSVLVERFVRYVGEPPMHYLTRWRMQLASRLLAETQGPKMGTIAEAVGYESEAAFSRAFKREVGVAPGTWRQGMA